MKKPGHIWLLGLSGSGKSTLGPMLAQKLQRDFQDTDEIIIQTARRSIPEIFAREGEAGFRQMESAAIRQMENRNPAVVACGGGAVLTAENREVMQRSGTRVYLRVRPELLEERLRHKKDRPLLNQGPLSATLSRQLLQREPLYQESEIHVEAGSDSPEGLAEKIFQELKVRS